MTHNSTHSVPVWTQQAWLAANGYATDAEVDGHIHAGLRAKPVTKTFDRFYRRKLAELQNNRSEGIAAFEAAKAAGEIREPNRWERLIATARGHEDNPSVQAARRICAKHGVSWDPSPLPDLPEDHEACGVCHEPTHKDEAACLACGTLKEWAR